MTLEYFNLNQEEFIKDEKLKIFDLGNTIRIEIKVTISIEEIYYWRDIDQVTYTITKPDKIVAESGIMSYEDNGIYYHDFDSSQIGMIPGIYKVVLVAINGAQQITKTITRAFRLRGPMSVTTTSTSTTTTTTTI